MAAINTTQSDVMIRKEKKIFLFMVDAKEDYTGGSMRSNVLECIFCVSISGAGIQGFLEVFES